MSEVDGRNRRRGRRTVLVAVAAIALVGSLAGCRYQVAAFGDVPYAASQEDDYERLIRDVNADTVSFSVHVGDIQASTTTCSDSVVWKNIAWFDSFDEPLIYTPGDNEWTDCSNPLVRLQRLRELVFRGDGTTSRGRTTRPLVSQASRGYPENAIWTSGRVTYVTLHVVGSSDGRSNTAEQQARRQADLDWLRRAFAEARQREDRGIVVIGHSGLRFERAEGDKGAYQSLFDELRNQTVLFSGQVLYLHGDGHTFHDDRPMRAPSGAVIRNFRRVEVYGGGTVRWVKLGIDDESAGVFTVTSPPAP